jgi:benzoate membrane transport protein
MLGRFWGSLRDLPQAMQLSAVMSGLVVVLVSFTGPILIIIQAGQNAGLSSSELYSWIWAVTFASGLTSLLLSLLYRQPIITAWSSAGAALLVTSLAQYGLQQAIGAYIVAAIAVTLVGFTRLFGRAMALVPQPIALGMLAGVLLRFGIGLFHVLPERPFMVILMLMVFVILRRVGFRAPTIGALLIGLGVAGVQSDVNLSQLELGLSLPQVTLPLFTPGAALGLALPLFVLTMTSQNAPGFAVLRNSGYNTPIDGPIALTGLASLAIAPLGGSGVNLAAITAAICTGPEAHPDPNRRYAAGVATGIGYMIAASLAATAVSFFSGFPPALSAAVAGLALSGAIGSSLAGALSDTHTRDAALVAMLVTASEISFFGVGAPFWGLIFGMAVHLGLSYTRKKRSPILAE